jgi:hypothetical protein
VADPEKPKPRHEASGLVAIILAVGIVVALNVITIALLYAAVIRLGIDVNAGLSDNGVQVLLAWGGGIISVIAGYTGYVIGKRTNGNGAPPNSGGIPQNSSPEEPPKP